MDQQGQEDQFTEGTPSRARLLATSFAKWFLPVALLIVVTGVILTNSKLKATLGEIEDPQLLLVSESKVAIDDFLARPLNHLKSMVLIEPRIHAAVNRPSGPDLEAVVQDFMTLLLRNPNYLQVRWIDEQGKEVLRLDQRTKGNIRVVPKAELQDKSDRYYVTDSLALKQGEIFVSPLDLNIEHGEVEVPYVPVLRIGMHVFKEDGQPAGIFVINLHANSVLDRLAAFRGDSDLVLLNQDGYWLSSPRPNEAWGFMFKRQETFANKFPDAWALVSGNAKGVSRTVNGLWVWDTVFASPSDMAGANPIQWKVVARVPQDELLRTEHEIIAEHVIVAVILLLLFGAGFWQLARESAARSVAEIELRREALRLSEAKANLEGEVRERELVQKRLAETVVDLERHQNQLEELVRARTRESEAARKAADAANAAKTLFLGNMSHEMLTPLHQLAGMAELLRRDPLTEKQLRRLDMLDGAAQRLQTILGGVLTLVDLEAKSIVLSSQQIDFDQWLVAITSPLAQRADEKHLELTVGHGVLPEALYGDPDHLKTAFMCLANNAISYTEQGRVVLGIECIAEEAQSAVLRFSVEDTGIGIAEEDISRLFSVFEQVDNSNTRKFGGAGIGLAMVRKIALLMGGDAGCNSVVGKGSTFWFTARLRKGSSPT